MKRNEAIIMVSIIAGCSIFAIWMVQAWTIQASQQNFYEPHIEPTSTEIRQMCVDKMTELVGAEYVTPMGVNICVGTVLDGLNK